MSEEEIYDHDESKEAGDILSVISKQNKCKKCSSYILPICGGLILLGMFISSFFVNLDEILNPKNISNTSINNSSDNNNITYSIICNEWNSTNTDCINIVVGSFIVTIYTIFLLMIGSYLIFKKNI